MKKVILTLAAVALMGVANAQFFVGGNLGFGMDKGSRTVTTTTSGTSSEVSVDLPKTVDFGIFPKVGYQINDRLSAGLIFGFGMQKTTDWNGPTTVENYESTENLKTWEVLPFVRYNAFNFGAFTMFAELQIGVRGEFGTQRVEYDMAGTHRAVEADAPKTFGFGVNLVPGLAYNLNEHVSFDLYFNLINIGFNTEKVTTVEEDTDLGVKVEDVTKTSDFGLGIRSLASQNAVTIGFNYKF